MLIRTVCLIWLVWLSSCVNQEVGVVELGEPLSKGQSMAPRKAQHVVYVCANRQHFVVRHQAEGVFVFRDGVDRLLPRVEENIFASDSIVLTLDSPAILQLAGERLTACLVENRRADSLNAWERAALQGVNFRASGSQSAWTLEIIDEQVVLSPGAGEDRVEMQITSVVDDLTAGELRHATNSVELLWETVECTDSSSETVLPLTVSFEYQGENYRGCGRRLN